MIGGLAAASWGRAVPHPDDLTGAAAAGGAGPGVATAPWPRIPADEVEAAQVVRDAVVRMRAGEPPSVAQEERLLSDVDGVIGRALAAPASSGIGLAAIAELAADPAARATLRRNAAILASHLWPLSLLVYGADLENIACLGHDQWLVSMAGRKLLLVGDSPFADDDSCLEFFRSVIRLGGVTGDRSLTDATPVVEANVGSVIRLCVAKRPAVSGRSALKAAVRVPARSRVCDLEGYVHDGIMPAGAARFLEGCVRARANLLIAGGTSTGKTTLLRVLCGLVPAPDHLVVVEDGAELHLDQPRSDGRPWHFLTTAISTIPSVRGDADSTQLTMFDLVRHALRFQPDRLVLGESRGEEMAAVCKALMTGHDGSMTTIHAEDAELALDQAVQYVMENARFTGNEGMARRVVEQAVHLVVHLANQEGRRRVTGILAVERGGNHKWVYRQTEAGGLARLTELAGNLTRLAPRLRGEFPGDEVPRP